MTFVLNTLIFALFLYTIVLLARVVLDWVVQDFEPGQRYRETRVNLILARRHDDVAALRRYLVDEDLLAREHGEYWRIGGTVP